MPKEGSKGIARGKRRANESDPGGAHVGDLGGARSGMWGSGGAPLGRMLIEGLGGLSSAVGALVPAEGGASGRDRKRTKRNGEERGDSMALAGMGLSDPRYVGAMIAGAALAGAAFGSMLQRRNPDVFGCAGRADLARGRASQKLERNEDGDGGSESASFPARRGKIGRAGGGQSMRVGAGVKGTGSGSTGASPGSAQVSAGGASKASSGAAESSESSESSASSGSESESESSESESDKARDEKKVAGRGKARVMDGGKAGGKVAASKAGKTSGSSVGGRRASAGGKSDGSKSSESESSESESSAGESDGKRAAAAVPTGGKKRRRRRRRRGKKGSISFAGATEPVGGFAAQRGVTNVDAPPAVLAGGEGARVARAGVGAGASVRGSAAQAGGKEKGGMPRRFRFDDEGNKVDIEEEAASSDAALNIGAWSAPASHKKSCFEKQQKMQRQEQSRRAASAPAREQGVAGGGSPAVAVPVGADCGVAAPRAPERVEAVSGATLRVGDEVLFQRVELQGWVPALSGEQRARVEALSHAAGSVALRVSFAPRSERVLPRIRDPATGEWSVLGGGEEEEADAGEELHVKLDELQNLRRILA